MLVGICFSASALALRPPEKRASSATPKPETHNTAKSGQATVDYIVSGVLDDIHIYMDRHFHKGEYNHTLNLIKMAVAADPSDLNAYADGGYLLWSMDRDEEALALYKQGLKANPKTYY